MAEFGLSRPLVADIPKTPHQLLLSAVLQRREQLNAMLLAERNYLEHAHEPYIERIANHVAFLKKELQTLENELATIIASDAALSKDDSIIQSIPGIGPIVSGMLIAELPE